MKKPFKIYTHSPFGNCNEVNKIHLDVQKNDIEYTCPKCSEKHSYFENWFNHEPNGKSIMDNPLRYPIVKEECKQCSHLGVLFTMIDIKEDYIVVEDGDFQLETIKIGE